MSGSGSCWSPPITSLNLPYPTKSYAYILPDARATTIPRATIIPTTGSRTPHPPTLPSMYLLLLSPIYQPSASTHHCRLQSVRHPSRPSDGSARLDMMLAWLSLLPALCPYWLAVHSMPIWAPSLYILMRACQLVKFGSGASLAMLKID